MDTVTRGATPLAVGKIRLFIPTLIALEFVSGLTQGWIVPLLGEIGHEYQVPPGSTSWVFSVGLLSSAVAVPLFAMLGDRFGHQKILVISVALVATGSLMIACAPNFTIVLLGAAIQAPVAAFLPLDMALLKTHRPHTANRDIGLIVGALTVGMAAGSMLGGIALDVMGNLLLAQLLPAVAAVVFIPLTWILVPETKSTARTIDWLGALLLGIALVGILYGLSEGPHQGWGSPQALIPLVVGIVAMIAFFKVEARANFPLIDVKAIRTSRLGVPIGIGFLGAVTMFGNQAPPVLYLTADPNLLGYGAGLSAGAVGIVLAISSASLALGTFISYPVGRALGQKYGLVLAFLMSASGLLCMAFVHSPATLFAVWLVVTGIGNGIVLGSLPGIVIQRAPATAPASASGVYNTARTIAGSLAGAFVAAITTVLVTLPDTTAAGIAAPSLPAFQVIWTVFATLQIAAAGGALFLSTKASAPQSENPVDFVPADSAPKPSPAQP